MEIRMDSIDVGVTVALETDGSPVLGFNCGRQGQQGQLGIGRATRPTCSGHRERENVPQDLVHSGGEYLQGRRLHNLPG